MQLDLTFATLYAVALATSALSAGLQSVVDGTLACRTGAQFATALATPTVHTATFYVDVTLSEEDWAPYETPVLLTRNLTVLGMQEAIEDWPEIDMAFLKAKVLLGPGVLLNFSRVVLVRSRGVPPFQPVGLDLLASRHVSGGVWDDLGPAAGIVASWGAVILWRTCLPPASYTVMVRTWPRPSAIPGTQTVHASVPHPVGRCVNSSEGRLMRRCWPVIGVNVDVAVNGLDANKNDLTVLSGYIIWAVNFYYVCQTVMTDACIGELGPASCYIRTMAALLDGPVEDNGQGPPSSSLVPAPPAPLPAANTGGVVAGGPTGRSSWLAALLAGLLGGLCFALGAVGAALVAWRRRRRRQAAAAEGHKATSSLRAAARGGTRDAQLDSDLSELAPGCPAGGAGADGVPPAAPDAPRRGPAATDPRVGRSHPAPAVTIELAGKPNDRSESESEDRTCSIGALPPSPKARLWTAAELHLVPVTPLTPFATDIDLSIEMVPRGPDSGASSADPSCGGAGGSAGGPRGGHDGGAVGTPADSGGGGSSGGGGGDSGGSDSRRVALSPVVLGKGAFGKVVLGSYRGASVAVKLLNAGLLERPAAAAAAAVAPPEPAPAPAPAGVQLGGARAARSHGCAGPSSKRHQQQQQQQGVLGPGPRPARLADLDTQFGQEADEPGGPVRGGGGASSDAFAAGGQGGGRHGQGGGRHGQGGGGQTKAAAAAAPATAVEARELRALAQEVEVLARCRHPNVVRLLAANLAPPRVCLVMELMDTSLDRMLHGEARPGQWAQRLPLDKVLHIAMQVALALSYLHPTILHRDLKPANVLVSDPGSDRPRVKIADFGLSRLRNTVLVTRQPGVGTAPYMAPELFDLSNIVVTDKVDVWAFGVILWEMLTGERPWGGMLSVQIACAVSVSGRRLPLRGLPPERCPPKLRGLLADCWDAVPERRPAAAELVKTLALVQQVVAHDSRVSTEPEILPRSSGKE